MTTREGSGQRRGMSLKTRPVSWIKAALREFREFPEGAQSEIAIPFAGDAFRVVYAVRKHEVDLIRDRLKRLKETLR